MLVMTFKKLEKSIQFRKDLKQAFVSSSDNESAYLFIPIL